MKTLNKSLLALGLLVALVSGVGTVSAATNDYRHVFEEALILGSQDSMMGGETMSKGEVDKPLSPILEEIYKEAH